MNISEMIARNAARDGDPAKIDTHPKSPEELRSELTTQLAEQRASLSYEVLFLQGNRTAEQRQPALARKATFENNISRILAALSLLPKEDTAAATFNDARHWRS